MIKKKVIQVENISVEELTEIIANKLTDKIETRIAAIISNQNNEELLTREETATLLKTSYTTLWYWTKKEILIGYRIGNRIYYRRSEIMKALVPLKRNINE